MVLFGSYKGFATQPISKTFYYEYQDDNACKNHTDKIKQKSSLIRSILKLKNPLSEKYEKQGINLLIVNIILSLALLYLVFLSFGYALAGNLLLIVFLLGLVNFILIVRNLLKMTKINDPEKEEFKKAKKLHFFALISPLLVQALIGIVLQVIAIII